MLRPGDTSQTTDHRQLITAGRAGQKNQPGNFRCPVGSLSYNTLPVLDTTALYGL